MKIYVIRHGLTELNKQKRVNGEIDEPLALEGVKQAEETTLLMPKTIKQIYSSPLLRAKQTAEIISSKFKIPISLIEELTEVRMGSSLAGKSWEEMEGGLELKEKHRSVQFDYTPHGGESSEEVKKRVISFLKKIQDKYQDHEVLIVTHGGIIRTLHLLQHNEVLADDIKNTSLHIFDVKKILK